MFRYQHNSYYIGTARFNVQTKQENTNYLMDHQLNGCIYGFPLPMTNQIPIHAKVFVIEMLNLHKRSSQSSGYITGIGLVENKLLYEKNAIYSNREYNRCIYNGKFVLKRDDMTYQQLSIVKRLDWLLFHGKSHMKRSTWITLLPEDVCERVPIKQLLIDIINTHAADAG